MLAAGLGLIFGIIMGFVSQRSRFCIQGAFRDLFLWRQPHLFWGVATAIAAFATIWMFGGYAHVS